MTRYTTIILAVLLATACGGGSEGAGGTGSGDGGSGGGGSGGSGGGTGGTGWTPVEPVPPVASSAEARVVGSSGRDLQVSVAGADPDGDVVSIRLRLLDGAGADLPVVDLDGDGEPDSSLLSATPSASLSGQEAFTATATVHRLYLVAPTLVSVGVRLVDVYGLMSEERIVPILTQPIRAPGESCDPAAVVDRCETGKGCYGDSPICQEGRAPEITRFAYVRTSTSPRILIEGTEPEDDLASLRLGFLNSRGEAIQVDLDGDDLVDGDSLDLSLVGYARDGAFFVELEPIEGFDRLVPQLSASASDAVGHVGATQTAKAAVANKRNRGQSCDPRGFDECASGTVCAPGIVGRENKCELVNRYRDNELKAAPLLDPAAGNVIFAGRVEGTSVFDVPVDCSAGDPTGRPDAIAKLRLASPAARLTLTTVSPWTDFDTAVYLLPAEATSSEAALGCGDDSPAGSASLLELENVPAGDYLVVVDSWNTYGGTFELFVGVE